ncbi:MAG: 23S rRNA (uracil(1939)-C(5))-methyltransferase RlmD [Eubacteriaceae bacterium]|nr:23S rRNA (uracil(1939)-C(5))-methyltransferase RlmD [Eubacteriaceae bacterium]
MDVQKKSIIEVDIIEDISMEKSMAMVGGNRLIINGGHAGQRAMVKLHKLKPGRWEGQFLQATRNPSFIVEPVCAHYSKCGGCNMLDIEYSKQLELKESYVRNLLDKAKIATELFSGITPSPSQIAYRNKMEFSFGDEAKDGPLELGLHAKGRRHDIAGISYCHLAHCDISALLLAAKSYFSRIGASFYNAYSRKGWLRHLVLRRSEATGDILVLLVTTSQGDLDKEGFCQALLEESLAGQICGIMHLTNDSFSDAVLSQNEELLYGQSHYMDKLLGISFKISPFSFFQTNTKGAESLCKIVLEMLQEVDGLSGEIYDLYCGVGTFSLAAAKAAGQVVGVEISQQAVESAIENAMINKIGNCKFICGDVFENLGNLPINSGVVIADPPRAGLGPKALSSLIGLAPRAIVYVSCKPQTMARELPAFVEAGYKIARIAPLDMFPNTQHVETAVLLAHNC